MKRATLTGYSKPPVADPPDLTDRLLDREGGAGTTENAGTPVVSRTKRRSQPRAKRSTAKPAASVPETAPQPTDTQTTSLQAALSAADSAAEGLRQASHEAPARYDVALRYRLDALAHHLQQVKEFVASLAAR